MSAADDLVAAVEEYRDNGGDMTRLRAHLYNACKPLRACLRLSGERVPEPVDPAVTAAVEALLAAYQAGDGEVVAQAVAGLRAFFGRAVLEPAGGWR